MSGDSELRLSTSPYISPYMQKTPREVVQSRVGSWTKEVQTLHHDNTLTHRH